MLYYIITKHISKYAFKFKKKKTEFKIMVKLAMEIPNFVSKLGVDQLKPTRFKAFLIVWLLL